jgi:hypothetical protein
VARERHIEVTEKNRNVASSNIRKFYTNKGQTAKIISIKQKTVYPNMITFHAKVNVTKRRR